MQYEGRQTEKSGKRQRGAGAVEISPLAALGRNDIVVLEEYTCLPLRGEGGTATAVTDEVYAG